MIINFFYGKDVAPEGDLENLIKKDDVATPKEEKTILQTALRLGFCASGLYVSRPKNFLKFSRQQVGTFKDIVIVLFLQILLQVQLKLSDVHKFFVNVGYLASL